MGREWYLRYLFWNWWTPCRPASQGVMVLPSGWWQKRFIQRSNFIRIGMTARAVDDIRSRTAVLKVGLHLQNHLSIVFDSRPEVLERHARMSFSNNGTIFFICRSRTQITFHVAGCNECTTMAANAVSQYLYTFGKDLQAEHNQTLIKRLTFNRFEDKSLQCIIRNVLGILRPDPLY